MKKLFFFVLIAALLWSCSSGNKNTEPATTTADSTATATKQDSTTNTTEEAKPAGSLESLKMGMPADSVIILAGEPTNKETIQSDGKITVEDWWYGENRKVRLINSKVNRVVKDVAQEQELLKKLVEAKKKGDEAEVKRLMEEITQSGK